jgi:D-alanyl-D-alanine carboxypeptidase (penicillin-binding protein 5/6)
VSVRAAVLPVLLLCAAAGAKSGGPGLTAAAYIAVDAASGAVLFEQNARELRHPASTTKIMTALLLIEQCSPDEIVRAPVGVTFAGESSMHLQPGEEVSVEDLLYCILLRSANDACELAALHVAGSVPAFAKMMNARAAGLGARDTYFSNPHGLPDGEHHSTAYDLALIAREAMRHAVFRQVVGTQKHRIQRSVNQEDVWMVNHNRLLSAGVVDGIKTGYTQAAGRCFVGTAQGSGFRVISVVLGSEDWEGDTQALMQVAFATFEHRRILPSRHCSGRVDVRGGVSTSVGAVTARPLYAVLPKGSDGQPDVRVDLPPARAPIKKGQELGSVSAVQDGQVLGRVPLVADASVAPAPAVAGWPFWVVSGGLLLVAVWMLRRGNGGG